MKDSLLTALLISLFSFGVLAQSGANKTRPSIEVATDAYIYAYPLVLMELKRRAATNVLMPNAKKAPMNQFAQQGQSDSGDSLLSVMWYDVGQEPLLFHLSDSKDRYFSLSIEDAWSEIFASPGSRTTGSDPLRFILVGPKWKGSAPLGHIVVRSPTNFGRIQAVTMIKGLEDLSDAKKFQAEITAMKLSDWREKRISARDLEVEESWDMKHSPQEILDKMSVDEFFTLFSEIVQKNPPHEVDWNIIQQMRLVGIYVDQKFSFKQLGPNLQTDLKLAMEQAKVLIKNHQLGFLENGWSISRDRMATYGSSYLLRAGVAFEQKDVSLPEDILTTETLIDNRGERLNGESQYTLRFGQDELPPVHAFWSLSLLDKDDHIYRSKLKKSTIISSQNLFIDKDGSLTIYLQPQKTVNKKLANWMPTPAGNFSLSLNLYYPQMSARVGEWLPPPVLKGKSSLLSE